MRVDGYVGDHEGNCALGVAVLHRLVELAALVAVPYDRHTLLLGLEGAWEEADDHVVNCKVERALLGEGLHVSDLAVVVDLAEADPSALHLGNAYRPVVKSGPEGHAPVGGVYLPASLVLLLVHAPDELVYVVDELTKPELHLLLVHLKLVQKTVDLVDEQNRMNVLFESLSKDRLSLGHGTLHGVHDDDGAVNGSHRPCDVAAEVDVTRGVDHVDEVLLALVLVDHGDVGRIDGDPSCLLQLVKVHK